MDNIFDKINSTEAGMDVTDEQVKNSRAKALTAMQDLVDEIRQLTKDQQELASAFFNIFLDDDGCMKDFGQAKALNLSADSILHNTERVDFCTEVLRSLPERINEMVPKNVETKPSPEFQKKLDEVLATRKEILKQWIPILA